MIPKNLNWTREELILALELYFRLGRMPSSKNNPEVVKLSDFLKSLPIYPLELRKPEFRNPAGVYSKLGNFLCYDPTYSGVGRPNGSHLDEEVWNEFFHDRTRLVDIAKALWNNAADIQALDYQAQALEDEFAEGAILTRLHQFRERNRAAVREKKRQFKIKHGQLSCEVCDFDFEKTYGSLGKDFAECHHTKAVATLISGEKTKIADLSIVCANCHRMIHRSKPMLGIKELRHLINSAN